jgi:hypothetical protein
MAKKAKRETTAARSAAEGLSRRIKDGMAHEKPAILDLPRGGVYVRVGPKADVRIASIAAKEQAISEIMVKAGDLLGSLDAGMRWLGTPVRGLDFATPISILGTKAGAERVKDILGQMEHGTW